MNPINRRSFLSSSSMLGVAIAATATAVTATVTATKAEAKNCAPANGMTEEKFRSYIDAFNNDKYEDFGDFYADDVVLVITGKTKLVGHQAIFDFYKTVKTQTKRTIQVNRVIINNNLLAAELQSEFLALEDAPDFTAGPMKKGGRIFINTFVLYNLTDDGKFQMIRSAEFNKIDRQLAENQESEA